MQAIGLTRSKTGILAGVSLLAAVFTVALTFATLQLPIILGNLLSNYFPDIHTIIEPERVAEFMVVARPIGYACLGVIAILAVAGFVTGKRKLYVLGSFAFSCPPSVISLLPCFSWPVWAY